MRTRRSAAVAIVLTLCAAPVGPALGASAAKRKHKRTTTKTFSLASGKTKIYKVGYPVALKFANARYRGTVTIQTPTSLAPGQTPPSVDRVRILSSGPAEGGSVFRAKVRNGNDSTAAPAIVRITTTTTF